LQELTSVHQLDGRSSLKGWRLSGAQAECAEISLLPMPLFATE